MNGSQKLTDLVLAAYRTFGVGVVGDMDPTATGEMGAIFRLTPSLQLIRSPENKHTDADIPEYVPAVGLESVGRAYAKIIDQVNTLDLKALGAGARAKLSSAGARSRRGPGRGMRMTARALSADATRSTVLFRANLSHQRIHQLAHERSDRG